MAHFTGKTGTIYEGDMLCIGENVFPAAYYRNPDNGAITIRTQVESPEGLRNASILLHQDHADYAAASAAEAEANHEPEQFAAVTATLTDEQAQALLIDVITEEAPQPRHAEPQQEPQQAEAETPLPAWAGEIIQGNGFRIRFDAFFRRTCIEFDGVPCKQARELCKEAGFYWAPSKGLWVRKLNLKGKRAAEELLPKLAALQLYGLKPRKRAKRRSA